MEGAAPLCRREGEVSSSEWFRRVGEGEETGRGPSRMSGRIHEVRALAAVRTAKKKQDWCWWCPPVQSSVRASFGLLMP
jgi:hypothetical protein